MLLQTKDYKSFVVGDTQFTDYTLANRCLPGDEVTFNTKCTLVKRAQYGPIVGTLELTSKYLYGHTAKGLPLYLFTPANRSFPSMRVASSEKDTTRNILVLVEFLEWNPADHLPRGNHLRTLGPAGVFHVEAEALKWLYGQPSFKKVQPFSLPTVETKIRSYIEGITVNIDPAGCKDIDDVISIKYIEPGIWDFAITIADVAEWIPVNSPLDLEARKKGQTLYQNGAAVLPMFPSELSEDKASLLPDTERLGVSLLFRYDGATQTISNLQWKETLVKNMMATTYASILELRPYGFSLEAMRNLCYYLKGSQSEDPHEWIEELMILYNKEAAKLLQPYKAGLLRAQAASICYSLPELRFLDYEAATYEPMSTQAIHASIGSLYCHASSPLRRYADLVNQRSIKAIIRNETLVSTEIDSQIAPLLNIIQKKAKQHDRDYLFIQQIFLHQYDRKEKMGIVVKQMEDKVKIYVPLWKRIVSVRDKGFTPGDEVLLQYFCDMKKIGWKERMVFKVVSINSQA